MDDRVKVGVIGCGTISGVYFKQMQRFRILDVVACADVVESRARERALEFGIARACTVEQLLDDPDIQIAVNLTVPTAHASVSLAALGAGKHVYSEKPLAVTREEGCEVLATAARAGLRVGCAPDTFLGGGLQTCRKLIDDGWIGRPVAAVAFFAGHGPETWHANPEFFYQHGAGPLFDMGPYYLTALVHLLGPVQAVSGMARISNAERLITTAARYGETIRVETPTHVTGTLDFASGALGTLVVSFDVWASNLPRIEIYGSDGTLSVPDPNIFGGPVRIARAGAKEFGEVPLTHSADVQRGIGVADMANAIGSGRAHRASGALAYHVLDLMHAFEDSARTGQRIALASTCERPAPLPLGLPAGVLDA